MTLSSMFYKPVFSLVIVSVDTPHCRDIEKRARIRCGASGVTQLQCQAEGCCRDDAARDSDIACYKRGSFSPSNYHSDWLIGA